MTDATIAYLRHCNEPLAVAYRNDLKKYLAGYPDGADKRRVQGRLESNVENEYFSAVFELFLCHILVSRGCRVTPHPGLASTTRRPEFAVAHASSNFIVEARVDFAFEKHRNERKLLKEAIDANPYAVVMTKPRKLDGDQRIKRAASKKAERYGDLAQPYLLTIWPRTQFPLTRRQAENALYGTEQWRIGASGYDGSQRLPDGVFNTPGKVGYRNQGVSAVALYRERFLGSSCERQLIVYHNPNALGPLPRDVLAGIPQCECVSEGHGQMRLQWLNARDPWKEWGSRL